jgi:hypothetical protein
LGRAQCIRVYGVISRKSGKVNVFVGASGFPAPHVRIGAWLCDDADHRRIAQTAAVNAIASGSVHGTIKAIGGTTNRLV